MEETAWITFIPDTTFGFDQSNLPAVEAFCSPIEKAMMPIIRYPTINPAPNKPKKMPS